MNWDVPLEKFDGKTAFEVSKEGYLCHRSQQWTWFTRWLTGTVSGVADTIKKASEIKTYSPCEYGLYKSTVGVDTKADLVDNIVLYKDQTPPPAENTQGPTTPPGEQTPGNSGNTPSVSTPTGAEQAKTGEEDKSNTEDILIYCAMAACVIAIIVMAVVSSKKKK